MNKSITSRKWFYPLIFVGLAIISMLPAYTQIPYDPRSTQDVIISILSVSTSPYHAWGWVFHIAFLLLIVWIGLHRRSSGRVLASYMGINYLIIAAVQTNAFTEKYGFALQTGALISGVLLGILWLFVAVKGTSPAPLTNAPHWRWLLLPLALTVFWSPVRITGTLIQPNFDPLLLLTSPDFGLTYCFATPIFLFLLILFYPNVNYFAFRVTALNGLIYGLLNLTHWFNPNTVWMGVMHLPLLLISVIALLLPRPITRIESNQIAP